MRSRSYLISSENRFHDKKAIKVWDLATKRELLSLEVKGLFFKSIKFSADGSVDEHRARQCTGSSKGDEVILFAKAEVLVRVDVTTGEQTVLAQGSPGPRSPVVFAPKSNVSLSVTRTDQWLELRWTDSSGGFVLEERDSLGTDGNWAGVSPIPPGNANGEHAVTVGFSGSKNFFGCGRGRNFQWSARKCGVWEGSCRGGSSAGN